MVVHHWRCTRRSGAGYLLRRPYTPQRMLHPARDCGTPIRPQGRDRGVAALPHRHFHQHRGAGHHLVGHAGKPLSPAHAVGCPCGCRADYAACAFRRHQECGCRRHHQAGTPLFQLSGCRHRGVAHGRQPGRSGRQHRQYICPARHCRRKRHCGYREHPPPLRKPVRARSAEESWRLPVHRSRSGHHTDICPIHLVRRHNTQGKARSTILCIPHPAYRGSLYTGGHVYARTLQPNSLPCRQRVAACPTESE